MNLPPSLWAAAPSLACVRLPVVAGQEAQDAAEGGQDDPDGSVRMGRTAPMLRLPVARRINFASFAGPLLYALASQRDADASSCELTLRQRAGDTPSQDAGPCPWSERAWKVLGKLLGPVLSAAVELMSHSPPRAPLISRCMQAFGPSARSIINAPYLAELLRQLAGTERQMSRHL
jgi:hypothetical protein